MIDASPGTGPNDIHDFVLEDDVSIIMNTKELFEEQDEKENMEAEGKIMLFSPIKEVLQVWKHRQHQPVVTIAGSYVDSNSL